MRADLRDALSALADGEAVDPRLVAEAVREPDAGALILALAETRSALRDTTSEPSDAFSIRVERALAHQGRPRLLLVKRLAPAVCAGLGLTAGMVLGVLLAPLGPQRDAAVIVSRPAPPAAVVSIPVGPPVPPAAVATPQLPAVRKLAPPTARNVYRFQVGRNWREGS